MVSSDPRRSTPKVSKHIPPAGSSQPAVVWSTLSAVGVLLACDFARWTFPRRWFAHIWLPEHIYKMCSALFGMISALVGNVVRWGQPWSQIAPSAGGMLVIFYWWWRVAGKPGTFRVTPPMTGVL